MVPAVVLCVEPWLQSFGSFAIAGVNLLVGPFGLQCPVEAFYLPVLPLAVRRSSISYLEPLLWFFPTHVSSGCWTGPSAPTAVRLRRRAKTVPSRFGTRQQAPQRYRRLDSKSPDVCGSTRHGLCPNGYGSARIRSQRRGQGFKSPHLHISTPEWMTLKINLQAVTGTAVQPS